MKVTNIRKFLDELSSALFLYVDKAAMLEKVIFKAGFPVTQTYNRTLEIDNHIYITLNDDFSDVELYDTKEGKNITRK